MTTGTGITVEQPLWHALTGYRLLTLVYAVALGVIGHEAYTRPHVAVAYFTVLTGWTLATAGRVLSAERCTTWFLAGDLTVALAGVLLTRSVETAVRIEEGASTLPSIWTAGAVLGCALKGGWRWAAGASGLVGVANLVVRGEAAQDTTHDVLLVGVASVAIGYVVEVVRASERTLSRALRIEAATRERERLARDIHDGVLQVLAMVQRRGTALGGEAAELGRLAGEQEEALRTLVSSGPAAGEAPGGVAAGTTATRHDDPCDLRGPLAGHGGGRVTYSGPATPVLVPPGVARELSAAVGTALDNVRRHAGPAARAWILLEDEPGAVLVTVRDDGPGIADGRLAAAEAEGRMGVALSLRARLRDLGGTAELVTVPGQGTEVELRVPRHD